MRVRLLVVSLLLGSGFHGVAAESTRIVGVEFVGEHRIESGRTVDGTPFGGISALDRAPDGTWFLLSDDRGVLAPARFYTASIEIGDEVDVVLDPATFLDRPGGGGYDDLDDPARNVDPEGLRWHEGLLWWTSEGDRERRVDPFVRVAHLDGRFDRELPLPPIFRMADDRGPHHNFALESLSMSVDGRDVWIVNEGPLVQDGALASWKPIVAPVRLTRVDTETGAVHGQFVIELDPIHAAPKPLDAFALNGITEILALDATRLLVLERALAAGVGFDVRLYEVDVSGASDVQDVGSLAGASYRPVTKRLLLNLSGVDLESVDNLEGMAFGDRLPDGRRTLVLVSDDNFNAAQVTQFVVLAVDEEAVER